VQPKYQSLMMKLLSLMRWTMATGTNTNVGVEPVKSLDPIIRFWSADSDTLQTKGCGVGALGQHSIPKVEA